MNSGINAFENMLYFAVSAVLGLLVGALGEVLDYRICITLCGISAVVYTKEGEI